jgi:DNA-binding GntR family transcriptional regulator
MTSVSFSHRARHAEHHSLQAPDDDSGISSDLIRELVQAFITKNARSGRCVGAGAREDFEALRKRKPKEARQAMTEHILRAAGTFKLKSM